MHRIERFSGQIASSLSASESFRSQPGISVSTNTVGSQTIKQMANNREAQRENLSNRDIAEIRRARVSNQLTSALFSPQTKTATVALNKTSCEICASCYDSAKEHFDSHGTTTKVTCGWDGRVHTYPPAG